MSNELEYVPAFAGGPTMRGFLPGIRFHADPGGGGGDPGGDGGAAAPADGQAGTAVADAPVDDAAATPAVAAPAAPATEPWDDDRYLDLVDQRAQQIFETRIAPIVPLLEQFLGNGGAPGATGAAAAGADAGGELNPWDPSFAGSLDARFARMEQLLQKGMQQLAQPMMAREQAELEQEGNQRLQDMLADDIARNGEFPRTVDPATGQPVTESKAEKLVTPLAQMIFPSIAEKFGETPRAAELAMGRAAAIVREIVAEASAAALNQETNRLGALADAHGEPGAATVGAHGVEEVRARSLSEGLAEVSRRHAPLIRGQ